MSGSSKKKLRKEQYDNNLTAKQKAELSEAKKLKRYTWTFAIIMVLVVAIVVGVAVEPTISGIIARNTHAITLGSHELSTAEFNYYYKDELTAYYNDTYNTYASQYGQLWEMMLLLNPGQPLNEQVYSQKDGTTWADHFVDEAIKSATTVYALLEKGNAEGFELDQETLDTIDQYFSQLEASAKQGGYSSLDQYFKEGYGQGATAKSYKEYYTNSIYATYYLQDYIDSLEYTNEQLRDHEKDKYLDYTSFTYSYYPIVVESYLKHLYGDKKDANTDYSEEQKAAALAAAKKDAESLVNSDITTTEKLNEAIKALEINKDNKNASSTLYNDQFYPYVGLDEVKAWISHADRKAGDKTSIEGKTSKENSDGTKTETINQFNVFLFLERDDNLTKVIDVRHILISFEEIEHDHEHDHANNTPSEAMKKGAKEKAEALLEEWTKGAATSESFAELANKNSSDSDGKDGGLYEEVYPGQMVTNFNDWCFDPARKTGDTGIVETNYGYHVMYFEKTHETKTHRDILIENDLIEKDTEAWQDALEKALNVEKINLKGLELDFTYTHLY